MPPSNDPAGLGHAADPPAIDPEDRLRRTAAFPTTQSFAAIPRTRAWRRIWPWVTALGVLATALLTAVGFFSVRRLEDRHLDQAAHDLEMVMISRLASIEGDLHAAIPLLDTMDRIPKGWSRVLVGLNSSARAQERRSVGYAAYVPAEEAPAFEARARDAVASRFMIKPRSTGAASAPLLFFDPPISSADLLGFDLLSDTALAPAVEAARDTAKAHLSERSPLGRPQGTGLVLVVPVFEGTPHDAATRQRAVRGFMVAPIDETDLAAKSEAAGTTRRFSLYSGASPSFESLLFGSEPGPILPGGDATARGIQLAGGRFTLVVAPFPTAGGPQLRVVAFGVPLLAGLGATLAAALHFRHRYDARLARRALARQRRSARHTDTRVRALVDYVVEGIVTYGIDGVIQTYNGSAERMFGYPPSSAIGKNIDRLLPRTSIGHHHFTGRSELTGLRAGGAPFIADVAVTAVVDASPPVFVAVINDITDKRVAERQLASQMALNRVLVESPDLQSAAPSILESVAQGFDASAGVLWLVSPTGDRLERFAVWGRGPTDAGALSAGETFIARGQDLAAQVWVTGKSSQVVDRQTAGDGDARATVLLATRLALPLLGKDGVSGVLEFLSPRFDPNVPGTDAMMAILGREIGQFVERKRTEAALVESEARYRELFESAHDLIQSADAHGRLLFANRAWREALGYTAAEVSTLTLDQVVAPGSRSHWYSALSAAPSEGASRRCEVTFVARTGRVIIAGGTLTTREVRGAPATLGIFRNVTEEREVERLKQEFVSTVSHELRTPLASIHGSLGLLSAGAVGQLPQDAGEVVSIAERNVVRLLTLINDLLDLEKLQSGRFVISLAATDMSAVLRRSVDAVQALVDENQIRIDVASSEGRAFADPDRIVQVVINLLSNAAKFSARSTVVSMTSTEGAGWVTVSVRDQGPGIPASHQETIFERFRQVSSAERRSGGTGLGLAICRTIVEGHGGRMGVESEEGRGSLFWFRLPACEVKLGDAAAHHAVDAYNRFGFDEDPADRRRAGPAPDRDVEPDTAGQDGGVRRG